MLRYRYLRPRYVLHRIKKAIKEAVGVAPLGKQGESPLPPPHLVKQRTVKRYGKAFHLHTLIETGNVYGRDGVRHARSIDKIYTIELDESLSRAAQERFA